MNRITRLYRIVNILMNIKNHPGIHVDELSEKCNVSKRTIYRDISILEAVGVPVSHEGGLRLDPGLFIPNISFTLNEAMTIKDACHNFLETEHHDVNIDSIIEKINSAIYLQNSPLYSQKKNLFANIDEYLKKGEIEELTEKNTQEYFEQISKAIQENTYIEINYHNKIQKKDIKEILIPICIIYQTSGYILMSKDSHNKLKQVLFSNIKECSLTNLKFKPDNSVLDFTIRKI